ncbi:MAG: MaoC/PaaZ C-terminal domain-containing protein [Actinomycetota bacterium]
MAERDGTNGPTAIVPGPTLDPATLSVGDRLPALVKEPTTRQLVMFAGASGDFYEIHYDDTVAVESGLPGVIVHGYLKMAWLGELVSSWAGPDAFVQRVDVSYRGIDVPGVAYRLEGEVTSVTPGDNATTVELQIWGEGPEGAKTTIGSAAVQFLTNSGR